MFKQTKKLCAVALASFLGLGGIAAGITLGTQKGYGINAEEKDYTLGAAGEKLVFEKYETGLSGYTNKINYRTVIKTSLGNDITFGINVNGSLITDNVPEDELFRIKGQAFFYNQTAISGIKKITFTPSYVRDEESGMVSLYFGHSSVSKESQSYTFKAVADQKYEVTFDTILPSYFGLMAGCNIGFSDFEVTYNCEATKLIGKEVTVTNEKGLKEALAYHSYFEDGSAIVLGEDIGLNESLYFYGNKSPKTYRINTNGHALKALPVSQSASSYFANGRTEVSDNDTSRPVLNIRENANIVLEGKGGIYANGADASIANMGGGEVSSSSSLTINAGTYVSGFDTMNLYIEGKSNKDAGNIIINGGTFKNEGGENKYLLNIQDATKVGTFHVNGGTFYGFNPAGGDYGHGADASENRLSFVNEDLFDVTSAVKEETTVYTVAPKSGDISLSKDTVLSGAYRELTGKAVTIEGNGHTISVDDNFAKGSKVLLEINGQANISNVTLDMEKAVGSWGIEIKGKAALTNVKIVNADHANKHLYTVNMYGGGEVSFVDCEIAPAANLGSQYYFADIWLGDGRIATFQGGTYGSIFANTSNGGGVLHSAKMIVDASAEHPTTIEKVSLGGDINSAAVDCEGKRYEAKTAYSSATIEGNDSEYATVKNVISNPDGFDLTKYENLTGKTITKAA